MNHKPHTIGPYCYIPRCYVFQAARPFLASPRINPIETNAMGTPLLHHNCWTVPVRYTRSWNSVSWLDGPWRAAMSIFHIAWLGLTMRLATQWCFRFLSIKGRPWNLDALFAHGIYDATWFRARFCAVTLAWTCRCPCFPQSSRVCESSWWSCKLAARA